MHFEVIQSVRAESIPLLVHVPHSSTNIPNVIRRTLCLTDDELRRELLCMTDWPFDGVLDLGGTLFVNRLSRLVVDPERFPDDGQEIMAALGMGAVYMRTAEGWPLRAELAPEERSRLLDTYFHFHPYAQAFTDLVSQRLSQHGRCVILDGHSFPTKPLPCELDQGPERPQIRLGTDEFHTDDALAQHIEELFSIKGLSVARNKPFCRHLCSVRFWRTDSLVQSVTIEVRRDLYMAESTGAEISGIQNIRNLLPPDERVSQTVAALKSGLPSMVQTSRSFHSCQMSVVGDRTMNVFDLRGRLVSDYASYTKSFLGHLGPDRKLGVPLRKDLEHAVCELEAKSVSYLVCKRQNVFTN